jgi:hypothetical protein
MRKREDHKEHKEPSLPIATGAILLLAISIPVTSIMTHGLQITDYAQNNPNVDIVRNLR